MDRIRVEFLMTLNRFFIFVFLIIILSQQSYAQLSPGDLHSSHAFLEGVENCSKCHGGKREVQSDKCLGCHSSVAKSITNKSGLHGKNEYTECSTCHVEHQGRDYELIYWEDGKQQFDHSKTGYILQGKHVKVDCQKCHQQEHIVNKSELTVDKRNLALTYMGLSDACASCHFDEHRGQLPKDCQNCHNFEGFKPVKGFDHNKAKFILTGKHTTVLCEKCHKQKTDSSTPSDPTFTQFVGMPFQACTDCHKDAHNGKLGVNCTGCHTTDGWRSANRANFDHNKTKFPLEGMHAGLVCEKCHKPGQAFAGLKFDKCRNCHEDYHRGEFAKRDLGGACEECHTVQGYRPAKFTVEQHQLTEYPLAGAHLAVPCEACHVVKSAAASANKHKFAFKTFSCESCHGDPHKGSQKAIADVKTCEGCHNVESWQQVAFDHNKTKFPLIGKHAETSCKNCHSIDPKKFDPAAMKFVLTNFACADCHKDIHIGQFASTTSTPATDCSKCHFSTRWSELRFDHNRDSAYKLEGAHAKVPCNNCHKKESIDSAQMVRYKPLGTDCKSCHDSESILGRTRP